MKRKSKDEEATGAGVSHQVGWLGFLMERERGPYRGKQNVPPVGAVLELNNPSKWQSWWVRLRLTVVMILGFGVIIWIGHWGLILFLLFLQMAGYRELSNIRSLTLFPNGTSPYTSPWLDM
jgi:hypothetical protein